jgi:trehalose synthase
MIKLVETKEHKALSLADYAADAKFVNAVAELRAEALTIKPKLEGRTLWMVNSTAQGGGVAEMLPRMISLMRDLGFSVRWAVITSDEAAFFQLTKRIHNLIHGDASGGLTVDAGDAALYETVNRSNAESFKSHLGRDDVVVIHDPQPLPMGQMLAREAGIKAIWRCHIGLDEQTDATRAAWRFLRPYLEDYCHAAFSVSEYIPSYLAQKTSIIPPALDPLSHKNRDLLVDKMMGILCNSGLQEEHEPVPTPDFEHQVRRVTPTGETAEPGEMGLLFRPVILQVSRWDRLKGWLPLMEAFERMKRNHQATRASDLQPRNRRRIELSRLVLAGPEPAAVADDPEALEVLDQITDRFKGMDPRLQQDVAILLLPMHSRKQNALIVNALQRCASIVVQNSIQEGFGLTVTEAMWKNMAVLGTHACGIRQQIRDGIDGHLIRDPEDPDEIAQHLRDMLVNPIERYLMGRSAQRRVHDEFLVFRQISRYFQLLRTVL